MENHRGITVGDPIGTIIEEVIDKTIEENVTFTQSQGGGKKGASLRDHVFILRSIIDIVIKQERSLFLTFYDVTKAHDNVDNQDLLVMIWEKGITGKTWRLLKSLCHDLTAKVRTRHGLTRSITIEIDGRQGPDPEKMGSPPPIPDEHKPQPAGDFIDPE